MTAIEIVRPHFKGYWYDEFWALDSYGDLKLQYVSERKRNTEMDRFIILVARLLLNDGGITGGILYHAQGRGDGAWASPTIPPVTTSDLTLVDEAGRQVPDSIVFLDAPGGSPTGTPTNVIKIQTTYGTSFLPGEDLREQALFGGDATASLDSGDIINVIRHDAIFKSGAIQLVRNIELELS